MVAASPVVAHGGFNSALVNEPENLVSHFVTFSGSMGAAFATDFACRLRRHEAFLPAAFIFEPWHLASWAWAEPAASSPATKMASVICADLFNIVVLPLSFTSFVAALGLPSLTSVPTAARSPSSRRNFALPHRRRRPGEPV
jgi:hypothetical protein